MESFEVTIIKNGVRTSNTTPVSEEVPLTIIVNGREIATLLCSPDHSRNLVMGFLYTAGLLQETSSLKSITIDKDRWNAITEIEDESFGEDIVFKRVYTSGCGKGVIFHNPLDVINRQKLENDMRVKSSEITTLMKAFQKRSEEHQRTRGIHSGGLAYPEKIIIFREDIGRHNAVDKVIGETLIKDTGFDDKIMLASGRISSEILSKILQCRVPVIAALGSPTNQAVKLAREANLTLVAQARGNRMIVFSGEERII